MIAPRNAELIVQDLSQLAPEHIEEAVLALPDEERTTLAQAVLPTHEQHQAFVDDISNPDSPNYDPDLAEQQSRPEKKWYQSRTIGEWVVRAGLGVGAIGGVGFGVALANASQSGNEVSSPYTSQSNSNNDPSQGWLHVAEGVLAAGGTLILSGYIIEDFEDKNGHQITWKVLK